MRSLDSSPVWPLLMAVVVASIVITISPAQAVRNAESVLRRETLDSTTWKAEQEADKVVALPGQPPVDFDMYAGYVTVDKEAGRAHYYYFVEAAEEPEKKPLVFWFNGGPGCSSIAWGFGEELGPFFINPGGKDLRLNPNAGNRVANVLFVESPAGVGFSYSNTSNDLVEVGDNRTAHDNYAFVVNWFERFPQYKGRPFYLSGESYAGFYVPQLGKLIYENNKKLPVNETINFKGFMVGNPIIERYFEYWGQLDYFYHHAMISDELYKQIKIVCNFTRENQTLSIPCQYLLYLNTSQEYGIIDHYSIFTPTCSNLTAYGGHQKQFSQVLGRPLLLQGHDPCTYNYAAVYFNRPDVQKAMHANTTGIPYPWTGCNLQVNMDWKDKAVSAIPIYQELLAAGLRLWVFRYLHSTSLKLIKLLNCSLKNKRLKRTLT
ncbi:hypothetical protein M758_11G046400 [Ceratodon purpureus]|nr:hypothetical protein M758_11G046400 [Ceratodon purpureus]